MSIPGALSGPLTVEFAGHGKGGSAEERVRKSCHLLLEPTKSTEDSDDLNDFEKTHNRLPGLAAVIEVIHGIEIRPAIDHRAVLPSGVYRLQHLRRRIAVAQLAQIVLRAPQPKIGI